MHAPRIANMLKKILHSYRQKHSQQGRIRKKEEENEQEICM
jgi:hypothetical protein